MAKKNKQLVVRTEIEGSPLVMVKHEGKWFLTMGKYRLSGAEMFESEEALKAWLDKNMWNVVATMAGIISEYNINEAKTKQDVNN